MTCTPCGREISDDAAYCQFCGAAQESSAESSSRRLLRRSKIERQVAGVCGGIAHYFDLDPVFVRAAWVVLTIIPGAILFGVLAYIVAWLIIPESAPGSEVPPPAGRGGTWRSRRLRRSVTDAKVAGVCGGIADYFGVDATAVRLLWAVLTIFPGAILCGVAAYIAAWIIMPTARPAATASPAETARA